MTKRKEPPDVAILAARFSRAFPSLSTYAAAHHATLWTAFERRWRRHCERCCNGDYTTWDSRLGVIHDPDKEERTDARLRKEAARLSIVHCMEGPQEIAHGIRYILEGDPRGRVVILQLPGEADPA